MPGFAQGRQQLPRLADHVKGCERTSQAIVSDKD